MTSTIRESKLSPQAIQPASKTCLEVTHKRSFAGNTRQRTLLKSFLASTHADTSFGQLHAVSGLRPPVWSRKHAVDQLYRGQKPIERLACESVDGGLLLQELTGCFGGHVASPPRWA